MIARPRVRARLALLLAVLPSSALACPVCMAPGGPNSDAFLQGTIGLSVLPLLLIFGSVYWLWRKVTAA